MSKVKEFLKNLDADNPDKRKITVTLELTKQQLIACLQKETDLDLLKQWARELIKYIDEE